MSGSLKQFSLGDSVGCSPHSVVSSLPTLADVRAYEEKEARVLDIMHVGYPRFMEHRFVVRLKNFYLERAGLKAEEAVLIRGAKALEGLLGTFSAAYASLEAETEGALFLVWAVSGTPEDSKNLKKYVQHTGIGVSSREAEDLLVRHGLLAKTEVFKEAAFEGAAATLIQEKLADLSGAATDAIWHCAAGMNAFYAAFRSIQSYQQERGRHRWIQLGWLYVDSGSILEKFLSEDDRLDCCYKVNNTEAVIAAIQACGDDLAAVVVECPSNPLIESCDLAAISKAVRAQGGIFLIDPTIASLYTVDVLKYADVLVTSLTKYAAHAADIMSGAIILNSEAPHAEGLREGIEAWHLKPYARDVSRLALSMKNAPQQIAQMQANAERLIAFMQAHPAIQHVHTAEGAFFKSITKASTCVVPLFSIVLKGSMERFYDAVTLMKGPSFGSSTTLVCPFMFLAHYDRVTSKDGRAELRSVGIEPDLIRIAVGNEPYAELEAVFAAALEVSLCL